MLFSYIKIGKEILTQYWNWKINIVIILLFLVGRVGDFDIEKVLVSKKISFGEKNYKDFIGCLCDNHKVKPLHIIFPKTTSYVKPYDGQTKWMYFLIENDDL